MTEGSAETNQVHRKLAVLRIAQGIRLDCLFLADEWLLMPNRTTEH